METLYSLIGLSIPSTTLLYSLIKTELDFSKCKNTLFSRAYIPFYNFGRKEKSRIRDEDQFQRGLKINKNSQNIGDLLL